MQGMTDYELVFSGRKIVDILKRNPKKDPSKYTEVSVY